MKNANYNNVAHLFSSVSVFGAESNPSITTSRFNVHGTFQINQFNSQIFNTAFVRVYRNHHIVLACR